MDKVLWAAGFMLTAALLFVLVYKRRYKTVPAFTAWIAFHCIYTITLFLTYRLGSKHLYAVLYWSGAFLDLLLQIGVVGEIARSVMRRSGRWVDGARLRLGLMGAAAPLLALLLASLITPAAETRLDAWAARGSLFTTLLICALFSAVVLASQQLGLGWRSHTMRESYGLILWTISAFVTDTLHAYWRTLGHFTALENLRIVIFQASLLYWAIAFWLPEPESSVLNSAQINRLDELTSRLDYPQPRRSSSGGGASPQ